MKFLTIYVKGINYDWSVTDDSIVIDEINTFNIPNLNIKPLQFIKNVENIIELAEAKYGDVDVVTIAIPGAVDPVTSKLVQRARWLSSLKEDTLLKDLFENNEKHIFHFENDANSSILGSSKIGKAALFDNVVYIISENGTGAALKINGQLYTGANYMSGEIGKMYFSGTTLESNLSSRTLLSKAELITGKQIPDINSLLNISKTDENIKRMIDEWYELFIIAIANVVLTYDPQLIEIESQLFENEIFDIENTKGKLAKFVGMTASERVELNKISIEDDVSKFALTGAVISYKNNKIKE